MPEVEDLLREAVRHQSDAYVPSAHLPERIADRVAARERRHRAVVGLAAAAACLLVGVGVAAALVVPSGDDDGEVRTGPADSTVATTSPPTAPPTSGPPSTAPPTSEEAIAPTTTGPDVTRPSTSTTDTPTTTAEPTEGPAAVTSSSPLTREGVGPIVAGMTVAEAEAASGNSIRVDAPIDAGSTCRTGAIDGTDLLLMMTAPAGTPDGQVVIESVMGGVATEEGVALGDTPADLRAAYGEPTEVRPYFSGDGGEVHFFEAGGFAYSATVDPGGAIVELESGLPASVGNVEGCA